MQSDADLLESSLETLAGREEALRTRVFERFLARWPEHRPRFLTLETTSRRMTDETLQLLHALAGGEGWVWPHVADLVDLHRAYGALDAAEYDAFIELVVAEACELSAAGEATRAAWERQGEALKALVAKAAAEWVVAMPR
jgi:hypothetical protein